MFPEELIELAEAAKVATQAACGRTDDERKSVVMASALLLGSEDRIDDFLHDGRTEAVRRLAGQIHTALHPTDYDLIPPVRIPWEKWAYKPIVSQLAESSVEAGCRLLHADYGNKYIRTAIGFGAIIADAKAKSVKLGGRSEYLLDRCKQLEQAWHSNNPIATVSFNPLQNIGDQLTFAFYYETT